MKEENRTNADPGAMYFQKHGERCEILAEYLIEHQTTVRQVAHIYGISKSTVHKDIAVRLRYTNPRLYKKAKDILEQNKQERHLRGGEATRQKYLKNREVINGEMPAENKHPSSRKGP